jgi:hypothetical protein
VSPPLLIFVLFLIAVASACRPHAQEAPVRQATANGSDSGTMAAASSHTNRDSIPEACSSDTSQGVKVTPHCFGPMPADSSLAFLAAHFPQYQVDTQLLETTPVLVWYYKIRDATAMVSQQSSSMELAAPAFEWRIWGQGILLPGGVPLPKTWAELRSHFPGPAYVTGGELGSQVEICELNGLRIDLGLGEDLSGPADSVPPNTPTGQVVIYPFRRDSQCH